MPTLATNIHVNTPHGPGVIQGRTAAGWLVRVAVTDGNRAALSGPACWTPKAVRSALFEIKETEITK